MCPKCGLFDEVRKRVPFTCNGCCLTRKEQTAPVLLRLLTLLRNRRSVACTVPEHFRLDTVRNLSEKVEAARQFSYHVYDVWHAGFHEIARRFLAVLIELILRMARNNIIAITSPSQWIRMEGGSHSSRKVLETLSVARRSN